MNFGPGEVSNIDIDKSEEPVKLNNIGIKHYNNGNYKVALAYFDKALAVAPQFDEAKKNRIFCIQMLRQKRREVHAKALSKEDASPWGFKPGTFVTEAKPVEVRPLDYKATRFQTYHDYGKIPKKGNYDDQLGWGRVGRR